MTEREPNSDLVEVVKCSDCAFYDRKQHYCKHLQLYIRGDWFCADALKKDGERNEVYK